MLAVFERQTVLLGLLVLSVMVLPAPARADIVTVHVDQAELLKLPDAVATVVVGNPAIADVTLQGAGMLVVTGKGYGATNLMALDRDGRVVLNNTVQVLGPSGQDLVVVYKGVERESYSCAPQCQPRVMLGDHIHNPNGTFPEKDKNYFNRTLQETSDRNNSVQSSTDAGASR
jgi:hypothetical protein